MSPLEIAELAKFIRENGYWDQEGNLDVADLASKLGEKYVIFERTLPTYSYCDECGFSATGHHPRCTQYQRTRTNGKIAQ
jgi:hypothetical protein